VRGRKQGFVYWVKWDLLATLRCDVAQGYYLSRPVPAEDLERWLGERIEAAAGRLDEGKEVVKL
jgi:hypothetical protein